MELTPYIYRMPGVLDPGCEGLVTQRAVELLRWLWDRAEIDNLGEGTAQSSPTIEWRV